MAEGDTQNDSIEENNCCKTQTSTLSSCDSFLTPPMPKKPKCLYSSLPDHSTDPEDCVEALHRISSGDIISHISSLNLNLDAFISGKVNVEDQYFNL